MNTEHKDKYSLFGENRYGFCKENSLWRNPALFAGTLAVCL